MSEPPAISSNASSNHASLAVSDMSPVQNVSHVPGPYRMPSPPLPLYAISPYLKTNGLWIGYIPSYLKKELIECTWAVSDLPFSSGKGRFGGRNSGTEHRSHGVIVRQKGEILCKTHRPDSGHFGPRTFLELHRAGRAGRLFLRVLELCMPCHLNRLEA